MPQTAAKVATHDPVWSKIREAATAMAADEPMLASFLHATVLNHQKFEQALSYHLAQRLGSVEVRAMLLRQVFDEAYEREPEIGGAVEPCRTLNGRQLGIVADKELMSPGDRPIEIVKGGKIRKELIV